ncbi:MAG: hypothetical protein KGI58_04150 [Patescibacteria group bacterium]|nr:hypothetical protein [Patescibacteria group bacterium]
MKKLIIAIGLLLISIKVKAANPYIQGLWTKDNPIYTTQVVMLHTNNLSYDRMATEIAPIYHPLSAGSLCKYAPLSLQPYCPEESWALSIGGSYAAAGFPEGGNGSLAGGFGVNLLDTARAYLSKALESSSNLKLDVLGAIVDPVNGQQKGLSLFASYQWQDNQIHPGKFSPRWAFGLGYAF